MGYKVVVVGATGNVGREMLNILAEREFPVDEIAALASRKSLGTYEASGMAAWCTMNAEAAGFTTLWPRGGHPGFKTSSRSFPKPTRTSFRRTCNASDLPKPASPSDDHPAAEGPCTLHPQPVPEHSL